MLLTFSLGDIKKGHLSVQIPRVVVSKNVKDKHSGLYSTKSATVLLLDLLLDSLTVFSLMFHGNDMIYLG